MKTIHHPENTRPARTLHIVIVGGGLGGLTAAAVLQRHGLNCTVYELDSSPHARTQGGSLDIHSNTGQLALREAGVFDAFLKSARPEDQSMRILHPNGTCVNDLQDELHPDDFSRPEIDRGPLRDVLLSGVSPDRIQWGKRLQTVQANPDGTHTLTFHDQTTTTADLVIGSDGAWSRVRPLLTMATPEYCGISFLELRIPNVDTQHPEVAALVGPGKMFVTTQDQGLILQRNGDGSLRMYVALRVPQDWLDTCGIDWHDASSAKQALHERFEGWNESFLKAIEVSEHQVTPRRINALPIGLKWSPLRGLTLIGDAAHLMSPFAGEGANLALIDGAELALAIVNHPADLNVAVQEYETKMFARSEEAARMSALSQERIFGSNGSQGFADWFMEAVMNQHPELAEA